MKFLNFFFAFFPARCKATAFPLSAHSSKEPTQIDRYTGRYTHRKTLIERDYWLDDRRMDIKMRTRNLFIILRINKRTAKLQTKTAFSDLKLPLL